MEVLSTKYPTPAEHLNSFRTLLDDLSRCAVQLPFTISGPTEATVDESAAAPTPLFVYNFLLQNERRGTSRPLRTALNIILAAPHRRLSGRVALGAHRRSFGSGRRDAFTGAYAPRAPRQDTREPGHRLPSSPQPPYAHSCVAGLAVRHLRYARRTASSTAFWANSCAPRRKCGNRVVATSPSGKPDSDRWSDRLYDRGSRGGNVRRSRRHGRVPCLVHKSCCVATAIASYRRCGGSSNLPRHPFYANLQTAIDFRDVAMLYEFWCSTVLSRRIVERCCVVLPSPRHHGHR